METIFCPKCGRERKPTGIDEDDRGEHECQGCGFKFHVEIEYSPTYSTACMIHEFGPFETRSFYDKKIDCRFCAYCGKCQLREEAEEKNDDAR